MAQFSTTDAVSSLNKNQLRALSALLTTTSIAEAAKKSSLSVSTLKRYLADDGFRAVYRQQQLFDLEQSVAGMASLTDKAIETLRAAMDSEEEAVRVRAAIAMLDRTDKRFELVRRVRDQEETEARLRALEQDDEVSSSVAGNGSYRW